MKGAGWNSYAKTGTCNRGAIENAGFVGQPAVARQSYQQAMISLAHEKVSRHATEFIG